MKIEDIVILEFLESKGFKFIDSNSTRFLDFEFPIEKMKHPTYFVYDKSFELGRCDIVHLDKFLELECVHSGTQISFANLYEQIRNLK